MPFCLCALLGHCLISTSVFVCIKAENKYLHFLTAISTVLQIKLCNRDDDDFFSFNPSEIFTVPYVMIVQRVRCCTMSRSLFKHISGIDHAMVC